MKKLILNLVRCLKNSQQQQLEVKYQMTHHDVWGFEVQSQGHAYGTTSVGDVI